MVALLFLQVAVLVRRAISCRWAVYAGTTPEPASSLFVLPPHSLAHQSYKEPVVLDAASALHFDEEKFYIRNHKINKDGWGLGWYSTNSPQGSAKRYRDPDGATDGNNAIDPDLQGIVSGIRSHVLFGHVRAATAGRKQWANTHPFLFNDILWMHNGGVSTEVERGLEALLSCSYVKDLVKGEADSEDLGGYFVNMLMGQVCHRGRGNFSLSELQHAMANTTAVVEELERKSRAESGPLASSLNLAASDGEHVLATRYRTKRDEDPPSLYYARTPGALWIASEPLDGALQGMHNGAPRVWSSLAKDQMLSYTVRTDTLQLQCLSASCHSDVAHRSKSGGILRGEL